MLCAEKPCGVPYEPGVRLEQLVHVACWQSHRFLYKRDFAEESVLLYYISQNSKTSMVETFEVALYTIHRTCSVAS